MPRVVDSRPRQQHYATILNEHGTRDVVVARAAAHNGGVLAAPDTGGGGRGCDSGDRRPSGCGGSVRREEEREQDRYGAGGGSGGGGTGQRYSYNFQDDMGSSKDSFRRNNRGGGWDSRGRTVR